jgi:hypothetical protein
MDAMSRVLMLTGSRRLKRGLYEEFLSLLNIRGLTTYDSDEGFIEDSFETGSFQLKLTCPLDSLQPINRIKGWLSESDVVVYAVDPCMLIRSLEILNEIIMDMNKLSNKLSHKYLGILVNNDIDISSLLSQQALFEWDIFTTLESLVNHIKNRSSNNPKIRSYTIDTATS